MTYMLRVINKSGQHTMTWSFLHVKQHGVHVCDWFLFLMQDPDLREAAGMLQQALNAETVQEEERLWTEVCELHKDWACVERILLIL